MSGLFGGKKASSQKSKAVSALQVQTSTFGQVLPLAYGKNRMAGNLGWYGNWIATAHTDQQASGGKGGGGGSSTSTSYTYTTGVIILLCEGPIAGIGTVWKDKELHTLSDLGFTLFIGTTPQTAWSWLQSYNSSQAIPYSGMAYVGASALQLGSSTGLPNLNYEVKGLKPYQAGTVDDALPSDILTDYLTDSVHGAGFGGYLGSTTQLANYCLARGLFMSPIEDQQRTAADFVNDMATWCNFAPVWSYNVLNLLPYGDTAISSSYGSYTPNVTPIYALGADDFKYEQGNQSGVELDWKELEQCHNSVRVEYNDRSNSYNTVTQEAKDQADIDARGPYPMSSTQINGITSAQVARDVAQLMLQRDLYIRKTYHFRTDMRYMLLEPMDIVTLTDPNAGLTNELVRITKVTEQNDELDFEAEELPIGVASAPQYAPQNPGGYSQDFNVSPGSVSAPVIFNAPGLLTKDGFEMWVAVAGIGQFWGGCDVYVSEDNTTYQRVGRITAPARYGALTAALPVGGDPDTTNTAQVSLLRGQLNSGTQADADNWRQMAFVGGTAGGEVIAFETATLTGTLSYSLSYLRRGGYGSSSQAHVSGDVFARIDEAIFRLPYDKGKRGNTVYFKFTSFNVFGGAMEQLSAVTAYSHVVGASDVLASTKLYDQLAGQYASPSSGSNFVPNPSFELNNINAPASVAIANMPVCDSWYVYPGSSTVFSCGVDTAAPEVGNRDLTISAIGGSSVPANSTIAFRVVSAPIYVAPGQLLSFSGDIRTDSAGGNPSSITWSSNVGMLFFNSSGSVVTNGDVYVAVPAAANSATGAYATHSSGQITVPAGASYAVVYVYLSASNSSASAVTLNSWASRFDNLVGTFVTAANQVNYASGQTAESLKPAMANADNTATVTGVYVINPGFENGGTGWTTLDSSNAWGFENNANGPNPGTTNHCAHGGTTQATCILTNNANFPVVGGQVVKATCKVRAVSSPNGNAGCRIEFYDSTGAPISAITGSIVTSGTSYSVASGAAPSNAVNAQVGIFAQSQTTGYYTYDDITMVTQPSSMDEVPDSSTRFAAVLNAAEQQAAYTPGGNLVPNAIPSLGSSFYTLGSGWSVTSLFGAPCFVISVPGTSTTSTCSTNTFLCSGSTVSASADILVAASFSSGDLSAYLNFFNASGGSTGSSGRIFTQNTSTPNAFQRVSLNNIAVPSGTTQAQIVFFIETAAGSGAVYVRRLKVEFGATATPFNDDTTQFGNLLTKAGSGQQIGDQRNLKQRTVTNIPAKVPTTISYSASAGTPATATISVGAFTVLNGSVSTAYNASSVSVTGTNGTNVTYYLYMNDGSFAGGTQTLIATTNSNDVYSGDGYIYVGGVAVAYPSSGSGSGSGGGGGSSCPLRTSWVIRRGRLGRPQHIRAGNVRVGDYLLMVDGSWGKVTYSAPVSKSCVRVIARGGTLGCSDVAPLKTKGARVLARDAKGIEVLTRGDAVRHADVIDVLDIGEQWVQHITIHDEPNDFFWTGDSKSFLFAHHNLKPP